MKAEKTPTLSERVGDAIAALKAVQVTAGEIDRRLADAEAQRAQAVEAAERDRKARDRALGQLEEREALVVATRAEVKSEVASLKASNELLAQRDREARDELERLSHMRQD